MKTHFFDGHGVTLKIVCKFALRKLMNFVTKSRDNMSHMDIIIQKPIENFNNKISLPCCYL